MTFGPSTFMRHRAEEWIAPGNTVRIYEVTTAPDVNPTTLEPVEVVGYDWTGPGLARQVTDDRTTTVEGREFGLADVKFWLKPNGTSVPAPERGYLVTVMESDDATLVGRTGTILTVERDPLKAVSRIFVRMEASS